MEGLISYLRSQRKTDNTWYEQTKNPELFLCMCFVYQVRLLQVLLIFDTQQRSPKSISPLSSSLTQINESQEDNDEEVKEKEDIDEEGIVNGRAELNGCLSSPEEHADVVPAGSVVEPESSSREKRLVNYGFVGGSLLEE